MLALLPSTSAGRALLHHWRCGAMTTVEALSKPETEPWPRAPSPDSRGYRGRSAWTVAVPSPSLQIRKASTSHRRLVPCRAASPGPSSTRLFARHELREGHTTAHRGSHAAPVLGDSWSTPAVPLLLHGRASPYLEPASKEKGRPWLALSARLKVVRRIALKEMKLPAQRRDDSIQAKPADQTN